VNLYLFAVREHASEETLAEIEEALKPPVTAKIGDTPIWYGSDDDAWADFERGLRT
jgi:hypothetical protein